ncbi:hypothetical protein POM88_041131 [Heracleum sosnowskyi]|uniref:Uncharacterized protein n=1 Tax=Heracleum sosnowskyi TaxID=360622 RepID=A0AAD8HDL0_9APIA|nr:hypothetical protein POM88_041131 [Heracleum sosnowskyi]
MVHTRFSSASQSPSVASVSHSKRKLKVSPKKLNGKNSKFAINSRRKKLTFTDDVVPPPEVQPQLIHNLLLRQLKQPIHSGTYMMSIAEYFVMRKRFPKESFDLDAHRSRIAFSFYSYGMSKQIYVYDSESECVDHVAGHGKALPKRTSPKKRRGGKVMTRKRKAEEVVGK